MDNPVYCMKCKIKTDTINQAIVQSSNNRKRIKGVCLVCNSNKSQFVKNTIGEGMGEFINNAIGRLGDVGIELHLASEKGENIPSGSFNNLQKYSYCGPGTKYEQRNREGYKGINELDSMCKLHDQFYNENIDTKTRNISDLALAHRAEEIAKDSRFDRVQRRDANFIAGIMKNKARFGLGVCSTTEKSKN